MIKRGVLGEEFFINQNFLKKMKV